MSFSVLLACLCFRFICSWICSPVLSCFIETVVVCFHICFGVLKFTIFVTISAFAFSVHRYRCVDSDSSIALLFGNLLYLSLVLLCCVKSFSIDLWTLIVVSLF